MKFQSLYTNTSSPKAITGLLLVTVAVAYAQNHADEIVDGAVNAIKGGKRTVEQALHPGKRRYHVLRKDSGGNLYDTGRRVWK